MKLTAGESFSFNVRKAWMVMRITTLLILIVAMHVSAKSSAQRITLASENITINQFFKQLKKQTGYSFLINYDVVSTDQRISVNVTNANLEDVLSQTLTPLSLSYKIENNLVYILKLEKPSTQPPVADIPPIDVHGRITDSLGNALAGASISVRGSRTMVTTDANGEFNIAGVPSNATLLISYIGYELREYKVNGKKEITIQLKVKSNQLSDVEVKYSNGYENIPKDRATGSYDFIDNALINRSVSTNILDRIYYVTSGLNYQPNSGQLSVQIRGISTINANPVPLIVVDNFEYDGDINNINPNDVESITVLKDAAAASIWGAKSGNGVIVIKTKNGNFNQQSHVQFNSNLTIVGKPDLNYLKTMSSADEINVEKTLFNSGYYDQYDQDATQYHFYTDPVPPVAELLLAVRHGTITQAQADQQIAAYQNHDVLSDDRQYLLQNAINQQYALNFSGGSSAYSYYGSVGYDDNKANSIRTENNRLTLRLDNTYRPTKNVEINGFINYTQSTGYNNGIPPLLPTGFRPLAPYTPLADPKGNALAIFNGIRLPYIDTLGSPFLDWHYRPLDELNNNDNVSKNFDTRVGVGVKYIFIPSLSIDLKYQYENTLSNSNSYYSTQTFTTRNLINEYMQIDPNTGSVTNPVPNGAILNQGYNQQTSWNLRGQLNFNHTWNQHNLVALVGADGHEVNTSGSSLSYYGYDPNTGAYATNIDYSTIFNLNPQYAGASFIPSNTGFTPTTLQRYVSYFANGAYTFQNKYTLSFSGRQDGANYFGVNANQRFRPFWSSGLMWNISKENFYRVSWLPVLKLRATYGYNGNLYNGAGAYTTIVYNNGSTLNGTPYAQVVAAGNPQLTWEKVGVTNLGVDFGITNQRITGTFEYYYKKGTDLIGPILIDATRGVSNYTGNNASLQGHGVDLTLNTKNLDGKIKWVTNFLFSHNMDKVISYGAAATSLTSANQVIGGSQTPIIGRSLYSLYSWKWAGLDPTNGDPRGYIADTIASYNTVLGQAQQPRDLVYNGPLYPTFYGSFRNTLAWKGLQFSFNITYKFGYYFRRTSINYTNLFNNWGGSVDYEKRWQNPGDEKITDVPSMPTVLNPNRDLFYSQSSILVERGDHIRLQDIRLSYDLSKQTLKTKLIQGVQIYIYANNIGILWRANKYGIDPDYGSTVIPNPRSVSFGLTANF